MRFRSKGKPHNDGQKFRMQIIVTLSVLFSALFVILVGTYGSDTVKWAYGIVGLVIGYWLRRA